MKRKEIMTWEPITKAALLQAIKIGEQQLEPSHLVFWNSIKVEPVRWQEPDYGEAGGGFWVVAVSASWVMWFNDIEDGFNVSEFIREGFISSYYCEKDELVWAVKRLYNVVCEGGFIGNRLGPPTKLS